jgi:hypothetical protein
MPGSGLSIPAILVLVLSHRSTHANTPRVLSLVWLEVDRHLLSRCSFGATVGDIKACPASGREMDRLDGWEHISTSVDKLALTYAGRNDSDGGRRWAHNNPNDLLNLLNHVAAIPSVIGPTSRLATTMMSYSSTVRSRVSTQSRRCRA